MSYSNQTPLHQLDSVISKTVSHIHDFTKSPTDFTRNRKLNAEILSYINPVRPDRADKRKAIKIKQALWFVYRVA